LNKNLTLSKDETSDLNNKIEFSKSNINSLQDYQSQLKEKLSNTRQNINDVNIFIADLKSKNILKKNFYLIDSIRIDNIVETLSEPDTNNPLKNFKKLSFNNLRTIDDDKLSEFKNPPSIIPFTIDEIGVLVYDGDTRGFSLSVDFQRAPLNLRLASRLEFALVRLIIFDND
jgi:hypothetical protein